MLLAMKTRNVIGAFQCLTNVLKPLTEESGHKLQSTENFFDTINTIQIPDDQHTGVFWREITVHQYSTSTGSRLYWERH